MSISQKKSDDMRKKFFAPVARGATFAERGMRNPNAAPAKVTRRIKPKPQELLKKGNGMGWQARMSANKQILANNQSGLNNQADNATARRGQDFTMSSDQDKNATVRRGQTQAFALGQAQNTTKRRGQDKISEVGLDRNAVDRDYNAIRRADVDSQISTRTQAFDRAENKEASRRAYADAVASGDERIIADTKARYETFGYEGADQPKAMSGYESAKIGQTADATYVKFASRYPSDTDPAIIARAYKRFMLRGRNSDKDSGSENNGQNDMNALFQ